MNRRLIIGSFAGLAVAASLAVAPATANAETAGRGEYGQYGRLSHVEGRGQGFGSGVAVESHELSAEAIQERDAARADRQADCDGTGENEGQGRFGQDHIE